MRKPTLSLSQHLHLKHAKLRGDKHQLCVSKRLNQSPPADASSNRPNQVMAGGLSEGQLRAIVVIERVCSSISMAGCMFTISTFCFSKYFSKSINRLVFYASFGNLLTNIATMISRAYIDTPNSAGCQAQAFLIQKYVLAKVFQSMSRDASTAKANIERSRIASCQPMYTGRWPWPSTSI